MRRDRVVLVFAGAAVAWCAASLPVAALASGSVVEAGTWRAAIEVPGLGALNTGGRAAVLSVSCRSAGNCAAGGSYLNSSGQQGFVVGERNGSWGKAIEVPGLGALNTGGSAAVTSVSCGSAGNCAAGGYYLDRARRQQGFVVGERNGSWGRAIEVPGLAALNTGGLADFLSVSCGSAGNCAAGGYYHDRFGRQQGFVVGERNGLWGRAIEVPGLAALNAGGFAQVLSVSCASAGNCAAGGLYLYASGHPQGFVVSERNGSWGKAIKMPGRGPGQVNSVSCGSAGNCAAGGLYEDTSGNFHGFVVDERNGSWGRAIDVPGLAALDNRLAETTSVSCTSAGNCAAGGQTASQVFVVSERNGTWHKAIEVPGLAALNTGRSAAVTPVSCTSAGNCAAGGYYLDASAHILGFVVTERNGSWGKAIEVPGLAALNVGGGARVNSVSCGSAGSCAAGGLYTDAHARFQGFLISQH